MRTKFLDLKFPKPTILFVLFNLCQLLVSWFGFYRWHFCFLFGDLGSQSLFPFNWSSQYLSMENGVLHTLNYYCSLTPKCIHSTPVNILTILLIVTFLISFWRWLSFGVYKKNSTYNFLALKNRIHSKVENIKMHLISFPFQIPFLNDGESKYKWHQYEHWDFI